MKVLQESDRTRVYKTSNFTVSVTKEYYGDDGRPDGITMKIFAHGEGDPGILIADDMKELRPSDLLRLLRRQAKEMLKRSQERAARYLTIQLREQE